jgi:hypothetical protein
MKPSFRCKKAALTFLALSVLILAAQFVAAQSGEKSGRAALITGYAISVKTPDAHDKPAQPALITGYAVSVRTPGPAPKNQDKSSKSGSILPYAAGLTVLTAAALFIVNRTKKRVNGKQGDIDFLTVKNKVELRRR